MKLLTHDYIITIYENGKFCWKNKGWIRRESIPIGSLIILSAILLFFI